MSRASQLVRPPVWLWAGLLFTWLAGALPQSAQAVDLSGCWSGSWQSCTTGHKGPLRATFTRCSDKQYSVDFSGRFFKLLPFRYSVVLDVVQETDDQVTLSGSSYLGRMFGTFTYSASATSTDFQADYSSCKDQGRFLLSRCQPCCDDAK